MSQPTSPVSGNGPAIPDAPNPPDSKPASRPKTEFVGTGLHKRLTLSPPYNLVLPPKAALSPSENAQEPTKAVISHDRDAALILAPRPRIPSSEADYTTVKDSQSPSFIDWDIVLWEYPSGPDAQLRWPKGDQASGGTAKDCSSLRSGVVMGWIAAKDSSAVKATLDTYAESKTTDMHQMGWAIMGIQKVDLGLHKRRPTYEWANEEKDIEERLKVSVPIRNFGRSPMVKDVFAYGFTLADEELHDLNLRCTAPESWRLLVGQYPNLDTYVLDSTSVHKASIRAKASDGKAIVLVPSTLHPHTSKVEASTIVWEIMLVDQTAWTIRRFGLGEESVPTSRRSGSRRLVPLEHNDHWDNAMTTEQEGTNRGGILIGYSPSVQNHGALAKTFLASIAPAGGTLEWVFPALFEAAEKQLIVSRDQKSILTESSLALLQDYLQDALNSIVRRIEPGTVTTPDAILWRLLFEAKAGSPSQYYELVNEEFLELRRRRRGMAGSGQPTQWNVQHRATTNHASNRARGSTGDSADFPLPPPAGEVLFPVAHHVTRLGQRGPPPPPKQGYLSWGSPGY